MRTEYIATNLYADYEDTFGDAHYFKGMVGYNYEQSTYKSTYVQRNGLLARRFGKHQLGAGRCDHYVGRL